MKTLKFISMLAFLPILTLSCKAQVDGPTITTDPIYEGCCGTTPVEFDNAGMHVYVPNVFTPNGDGINDYFLPYVNSTVIEVVDYTIYEPVLDSNVVLFYTQTIVYGDDQNFFAWNGLRPDGTEFKGPFRYSMLVASDSALIQVKGNACRVVCGSIGYFFAQQGIGLFLGNLGYFKPQIGLLKLKISKS
jgi:hypothetical protein